MQTIVTRKVLNSIKKWNKSFWPSFYVNWIELHGKAQEWIYVEIVSRHNRNYSQQFIFFQKKSVVFCVMFSFESKLSSLIVCWNVIQFNEHKLNEIKIFIWQNVISHINTACGLCSVFFFSFLRFSWSICESVSRWNWPSLHNRTIESNALSKMEYSLRFVFGSRRWYHNIRLESSKNTQKTRRRFFGMCTN